MALFWSTKFHEEPNDGMNCDRKILRTFNTFSAVIAQAARGLKRMEENPDVHQSIVGWNWILKSL
jgi:hypothetical protein